MRRRWRLRIPYYSRMREYRVAWTTVTMVLDV